MFGNLFFNLKRKNDTTYLTTNFLVPIYIIIDNSNSEDVFSKIGRIYGDMVSFSIFIVLSLIPVFNYFLKLSENIVNQYIVFPALAISIGFIFSGIAGMFLLKQKISFGFVSPFNPGAVSMRMPSQFLYFNFIIFIFFSVSALLSVWLLFETSENSWMLVVQGLASLVIASSAMSIGLKLLPLDTSNGFSQP
ncbi:hypothetical protein HF670_14820 [Acidithiobacillus thiooxidans]|jgi:hypothetical protein|uniref:hypothetical protein n=1 Tax=Acidithiobacillus thiooxidans TaxID=930 RepID=UPI001C0744F0|nr:hypothetical protein [Acidithiobacillus thiooxidans]MBU2840777.1 hypothetical protein [Acidithiobacillus thiooxidans]